MIGPMPGRQRYGSIHIFAEGGHQAAHALHNSYMTIRTSNLLVRVAAYYPNLSVLTKNQRIHHSLHPEKYSLQNYSRPMSCRASMIRSV